MSSEHKLKHLEFIQAVINRLSGNSFLLKAWSVTLVTALFALSTKDVNPKYALVAYLPVLVFWLLDAYFLSRERAFRALYDVVRAEHEGKISFSMDIKRFGKGKNSWPGSFLSGTLSLFYLSILGLMLVVMYFIR
jgi:hypothetical protein